MRYGLQRRVARHPQGLAWDERWFKARLRVAPRREGWPCTAPAASERALARNTLIPLESTEKKLISASATRTAGPLPDDPLIVRRRPAPGRSARGQHRLAGISRVPGRSGRSCAAAWSGGGRLEAPAAPVRSHRGRRRWRPSARERRPPGDQCVVQARGRESGNSLPPGGAVGPHELPRASPWRDRRDPRS